MTVPCPCCKAVNAAGPACRRCKADLAILFDVEAKRESLVIEARTALAAGDADAALAKLDEAGAYRYGPDLRPVRAAALVLNRDFAAAWACYTAGP